MKVIPVPTTLEERTFEPLVQALHAEGGERVLVDARKLRWIDPFGMVGLLALGQVARRSGERAVLQLPEGPEVSSYLARMGFFEQADEIFEIHGKPRRGGADGGSDVLLEITPIRSHGDIHSVVDRVQERIKTLAQQLSYPMPTAARFSVVLSEVCQNIVEHAEAEGWVATQLYNWKKRLGRKVAIIGVVDLGVGFKGSLASAHATRYGEKWNDAMALEAAFMHGLTRFHDPGRGQGLQQIRKFTGKMDGRITIRSGTARIAQVPDWDDTAPLEDHLAPFPGTQICIVLPAVVEAGRESAAATTRAAT